MGNKVVKIFQVLDEYPVFYQPYLPPVLKAFNEDDDFQSQIVTFKQLKGEKADVILPHYKLRHIKDRLNNVFKNYTINYLERLAINANVDIIHLQHSYLFSKIVNLLKLQRSERPKVVMTLRGGDSYVKPWVYKKWQVFYRDYADKVDVFIVMSEHQREYVSSKWGVKKRKIHVIPISYIGKISRDFKVPNKKKLNVLSVFRLCWEKNIEQHLRVIKRLNDNGVPVRYTIIGDGKEMGKLKYLVDLFDLKDCVEILGKIPNSELNHYYHKSDLLLQLSLSESLGMSVIEAQAHGLPAIVSDNGGLPEVIRHGKTGYAISIFKEELIIDSMVNLWENEELYKRFSQQAIKNVADKFTVKNEVESLTKLYKSITV